MRYLSILAEQSRVFCSEEATDSVAQFEKKISASLEKVSKANFSDLFSGGSLGFDTSSYDDTVFISMFPSQDLSYPFSVDYSGRRAWSLSIRLTKTDAGYTAILEWNFNAPIDLKEIKKAVPKFSKTEGSASDWIKYIPGWFGKAGSRLFSSGEVLKKEKGTQAPRKEKKKGIGNMAVGVELADAFDSIVLKVANTPSEIRSSPEDMYRMLQAAKDMGILDEFIKWIREHPDVSSRAKANIDEVLSELE